jgi:hypothetical protein
MKYYWTDFGNLECYIGGIFPLRGEEVRFLDLKVGETVKIYGEDVIADGIVKKDESKKYNNLYIEVTTEPENLDDITVEAMDGAFKNGELFGRKSERMNLRANMENLGFSQETINQLFQSMKKVY